MSTRYAAVHDRTVVAGPGDARPTALQIIKDEGLEGKLTDKVFLVTGASGGIGLETVRALYATGAHIFGTARDLTKGRKAVDEIVSSNPNPKGKIDLVEMELSSLESVRKGAADFLDKSGGRLNMLIPNAGIMAVPQGKTAEGFELQFGTNHLSHFLLFQLVKDALLASATPEYPSRVVSVSSVGHRYSPIRFDNVNFEKEEYNKWVAYGQSKTANVLFANTINRKYSSQNLYALAIHPGGVYTGLAWALSQEELAGVLNDDVLTMFKNPEQGAATQVFAAVGKDWKTVGGVWVANCQIQGKSELSPDESSKSGSDAMFDDGYAEWAFDQDAEERLWNESLKWVGMEEGSM